jgi:Type VI secretion system effector, Hcp
MKKIFYFLVAMTCIGFANAQTVGIGTVTPNNNAILDIFSADKGVLIPRILDTTNVPNPLEGMLIYNKNNRAPFFHNGTQWLSLGARLPLQPNITGSDITYQVTGTGFSTSELPYLSLSVGVSNTGTPGSETGQDYNLMKKFDINSKSFNLAALQASQFTSVEFKYYATGQTIPFLSIRLKNIYISSYQTGFSAGGDPLPIEAISIHYENYGVKDWTNNVEFGFNVVTHAVTTY